MRNEISSSSALNVILPILCEAAHVPRLPDIVRGEINRLRKLRNDIVHKGVKKTAVDEEAAAAMLTASVFGLEYLRYARPRLTPEQDPGQEPKQ